MDPVVATAVIPKVIVEEVEAAPAEGEAEAGVPTEEAAAAAEGAPEKGAEKAPDKAPEKGAERSGGKKDEKK